jgi:hypothetical protein
MEGHGMTVYLVSFHINEDSGSVERRYALTKAIHTHQKRYWDRSDGMVLFESVHSMDFLIEVFKRHLNPRADLFLLRELEAPVAALYGNNTDPDLMTLMPYCRLIPV